MAELAVVRRYAHALFETARHQGVVDQVEEDLKSIDQVFRQVPQLHRAFRAPTVTDAQKKGLLQRAFGERVSPLTRRFLDLTVERSREDVLRNIYQEFHRMANEMRNLLPVEVSVATALSDEEREALIQALSRRTGKNVILQVSIRPELMGGMVVRMGDVILDGSIRTRLHQLKDRLLSGYVG